MARRPPGGPPKAEPGGKAGPAAPQRGAALDQIRLNSAKQQTCSRQTRTGGDCAVTSCASRTAGLFVPKPTRDCGLPPLLLRLTCPTPSVDVRWHPLVSVAVVTQLVTHLPRAAVVAATVAAGCHQLGVPVRWHRVQAHLRHRRPLLVLRDRRVRQSSLPPRTLY